MRMALNLVETCSRVYTLIKCCVGHLFLLSVYSSAPVSIDSETRVLTRPEKKFGENQRNKRFISLKIARQARTDLNMVKYSSPNAPST
jgi:hypothetical protein